MSLKSAFWGCSMARYVRKSMKRWVLGLSAPTDKRSPYTWSCWLFFFGQQHKETLLTDTFAINNNILMAWRRRHLVVYRVWERVRKREKKIGSRDYSYVVHLYLQEYTCVYTTDFNRSIYINRRLFVGEKKSSSERKLIGAKFFNSISTLASDFEYHLSGFFFLPNRFARFFFLLRFS